MATTRKTCPECGSPMRYDATPQRGVVVTGFVCIGQCGLGVVEFFGNLAVVR